MQLKIVEVVQLRIREEVYMIAQELSVGVIVDDGGE